MKESLNSLVDLSKLPVEIQQEIASYLKTKTLGFFAMSHKSALKNLLPLLHAHQHKLAPVLTLGDNSTFYLQANQLFACGSNYQGQLGFGNEKDRWNYLTPISLPGKIKQVEAKGHTLVVTDEHQLWSCGKNTKGQLGLGHTNKCNTFTIVKFPGKVKQAIAGENHSFIITNDDQLWACGENTEGQLGLANKYNWDTFRSVQLPGKLKQVAAGGNHTLLLTANNQLWACGSNKCGQLGLENIQNCDAFTPVPWPKDRGKIQQIMAGHFHTLVITEDSQLWACGVNANGQLGLGALKKCDNFTQVPLPGKLKQVIAGMFHTFIITTDNRLWACGSNHYQQLGLGHTTDCRTLTEVPKPSKMKSKIYQVVAGNSHTMIITEDNQLWSCGNNNWGALGLGSGKHMNDYCTGLTRVKEKNLPKEYLEKTFSQNETLSELIKLGEELSLRSSQELDEPDDSGKFTRPWRKL